VSRDETLEHAFKRGAFFGGHTAKELDIILVGERGEERDQRRACACGFQSVRAAILRTFLAYDSLFWIRRSASLLIAPRVRPRRSARRLGPTASSQ
jgi:hypothetical protein